MPRRSKYDDDYGSIYDQAGVDDDLDDDDLEEDEEDFLDPYDAPDMSDFEDDEYDEDEEGEDEDSLLNSGFYYEDESSSSDY